MCLKKRAITINWHKVLLKTQIQGRNIASHKHLTWTPYWRLKWFLWVTLEASLFLLSYNCKTNVLELHHESKLFDAYCVHMKLVRWHILLVAQFATLVLNILITEMICVYVIQIYSLVFFLLDTPRDQSARSFQPALSREKWLFPDRLAIGCRRLLAISLVLKRFLILHQNLCLTTLHVFHETEQSRRGFWCSILFAT